MKKHNVKFSHLSILSIVLVMIVVMSAGCSSKPAVGSVVNSSSVMNNNFKWVAYQADGQDALMGGKVSGTAKIEKTPDNYQGIPAILIRATVVSSSVSSYTGQTMTDQSVSNIYLDTPMKNILGGTISSSVLGNTNYPITADTVDSPTSLIMLGCLSVLVRDTPLTYEGPQAVTVPAGTYSNADLYTHSASGVTTSYWIASGIPVKMQSTTETDVLTGWG